MIKQKLLFVPAAVLTVALAVALPVKAESAGQYIDDATITTKVKAALLSDKPLKATNISVVTDQGTVQLTGSVISKDQESEAVRVANQVDGVKMVKDTMTVRGSQDN